MSDLTEILEGYEQEFERGDESACVEAIFFCLWNNLPIPTWAVPFAERAVALDFMKGPHGRGRPSSQITSQRVARDASTLWAVRYQQSLARERGEKGTLDQALLDTLDWFAEKNGRHEGATYDSVRDQYRRAEKRERAEKGHSSPRD